MEDVVIAIPARYDSTRLPGKLAKPLGDSSVLGQVTLRCVATDRPVYVVYDRLAMLDDRVRNLATAYDKIVDAVNGTHRLQQWVQSLECPPRYVLNVQADEVYIAHDVLTRFIQWCLSNRSQLATIVAGSCSLCFERCTRCVISRGQNRALYFSKQRLEGSLHHVGVYWYSVEELRKLPETSKLAKDAGLEQLAWLEAGRRIDVMQIPWAAPSINSERDYALAVKLFDREHQVAHEAALLGYCSWDDIEPAQAVHMRGIRDVLYELG